MTLEELRNKIDAIDGDLLQLLAARAELVLAVGKTKHENGGDNNFIRSGREAKMIRELVARGAGAFPKPAIYAMWRGIISASLGLENGLKVALAKNAGFELHRIAVEYFGSFTKYHEYDSEIETLEKLDKHTVGVLTLDSGWWLSLAEEKHKSLKIFARLADGIFAIGKVEPESSGADKTLAIVQHDTHHGHVIAHHGKVKLVEFEGFHAALSDAVVIGNYGL